MVSQFSKEFERLYRLTSDNIFAYCEKLLRFKPTPQQAELFLAVQEDSTKPIEERKRQYAVKSGQGPGKTTGSTVIGSWRSFRAFMGRTIVTAPTMRQCKEVFMTELRNRLNKGDPYFRSLWKIDSGKATFMGQPGWGIETVTATKPENAQGLHQANMTVICEEASGIPREIQMQFEGTLKNPDYLWLQIGNPNTRECYFFDCFNARADQWGCFTWNAEDAPDFIVDKIKLRAEMEEYGRDSDYYRVRVLGEFPHMNPNSIMSSEDLFYCSSNVDVNAAMRINPHIKQIGIDLARYGSDESTVFVRRGNAILMWKFYVKQDPNDVVLDAFRMQDDLGWSDNDVWYVVDAGGMGQGVVKRFYEAKKRVLEFHFGGKSSNPKYKNKASEAWFEAGRLIRDRNFYIPNDNRLIQQLSTREYGPGNDKGRMVLEVENKQHYMDRGPFPSPDRADGFVMALYPVQSAAGVKVRSGKRSERIVGESHRRYELRRFGDQVRRLGDVG